MAASRRRSASRVRRPAAKPELAHVERLESRRPLAVSRLTWTIAGEDRPGEPADTILVDRDPGRPGMLRATVNDVVVGRRPEALVGIVRVFGGAGNDTITVNVPGNTRLRTQLFGNAGDDVITAGDQNDEIRGGGVKDTIFGGGGHDKIFGGADDDAINGGAGNDFVSGGADDDALVGAAGNDSLHGDTGRDTLRGGDGRNALDGGPGIDALYGTKDRDEVISSDAGEALIGNESTNPLRLAADPDQLKAWYIETAVARWGDQLGTEASWAWWRSDMPLRDGVVALAASPTPSPAQSGDFSGTNNQVAGVDEGDRVKTDGQHLFVLAGDGVDIVDAWPAESLTVVSHVSTPGDERYLFLDGTRLTVISQESSWSALGDAAWGPVVRGRWYGRMESRVHVTVIDVADPVRPAVRERTALDGWLVDARAIGSRVLVVTQDNLDIPSPAVILVPTAASVQTLPAADASSSADDLGEPAVAMCPPPIQFGGWPVAVSAPRYVYEGLAAYRARLEAAWEKSVLPRFTVTAGEQATAGNLVVAGSTFVPVDPRDDRLLSVASFEVGDDVPGLDAATSVAGVSGSVYASASNLYVSASHVGSWWDFTDASTATNIYQFDLGDASVPLVAMGSVPGLTLNQFSLDEHDGVLRVATTNGFGDRASSGVHVLSAFGGNLQSVGSVSGLAPGERIFSVRFIGDVGYLSTFRQVDPLFVIDLANPARPRVVGELKIPGFSSYLHPLDATHLLGVGRDVDPDTGRVLGLQLSIFDVSDPTAPRRPATYTFPGDGWGSWSAALWDHRALSWFPGQSILTLPVQQGSWWDGGSGLEVFKVDPAGDGFTALGTITHETPVERGLRIGEFLYSVSAGEVKVHRLLDPNEEVASVRLTPRESAFAVFL
jgi:hypothetical protein